MPHTLAFSPGGERLATLTLDGQLSVWGSALAPLGKEGVPEPPLLLPGGRAGSMEQWLGVSWWDDSSVVLHTRGGAVSVCRRALAPTLTLTLTLTTDPNPSPSLNPNPNILTRTPTRTRALTLLQAAADGQPTRRSA